MKSHTKAIFIEKYDFTHTKKNAYILHTFTYTKHSPFEILHA